MRSSSREESHGGQAEATGDLFIEMGDVGARSIEPTTGLDENRRSASRTGVDADQSQPQDVADGESGRTESAGGSSTSQSRATNDEKPSLLKPIPECSWIVRVVHGGDCFLKLIGSVREYVRSVSS